MGQRLSSVESECGLKIKLADGVAAMRKQLLVATSTGGEYVTFAGGPVEMESTVELRAAAKGGWLQGVGVGGRGDSGCRASPYK